MEEFDKRFEFRRRGAGNPTVTATAMGLELSVPQATAGSAMLNRRLVTISMAVELLSNSMAPRYSTEHLESL